MPPRPAFVSGDLPQVGCGGVGLPVIQGTRIAGAGMIAGKDMVATVRELTGGGADYALEVIGLADAARG